MQILLLDIMNFVTIKYVASNYVTANFVNYVIAESWCHHSNVTTNLVIANYVTANLSLWLSILDLQSELQTNVCTSLPIVSLLTMSLPTMSLSIMSLL